MFSAFLYQYIEFFVFLKVVRRGSYSPSPKSATVYVYVCVLTLCVCLPPRLLITSGVLWHDVDSI